MSSSVLKAESTLTDRYQTTIPQNVRKALNLSKRDKISYTLRADGVVIISRVEPEDEADAVMSKFLAFLDNDIAENPQTIKPLTSDVRAQTSSLLEGVEYNIGGPLIDEDE
ncbi:MAG: type II toxin-antitoxin system PrlF family antitoxin [Cyanobacteria bacterium J06627_28]